jgi:hypothetical protein
MKPPNPSLKVKDIYIEVGRHLHVGSVEHFEVSESARQTVDVSKMDWNDSIARDGQ